MTTKKNTAAAVDTNVIRLLRKSPYGKWLELIVNDRPPKFGWPKIIAMIGVIRSAMNALTSAANTAPMTNATASSTRLPRIRNCLNSCRMVTVAAS